jgi:hypothetical protein
MLAFVVIMPLVLFVFPILALPVFSGLGVLFLVRLYQVLKGKGDAVQWSKVFNSFACFALTLLFLTVFLVTNFAAFFVSFVLFLAISIRILNRYFGTVALLQQSQGVVTDLT